VAPALSADDLPTSRDLRPIWDTLEADQQAYLATLDDDALSQMVVYDMPHRGGEKRNSLMEILLHLVNHGTDHRAQLLAGLHQLGAPTFEQDFIIYLWDSATV
jgi:uncharacterized damage-inducible protein DinB